MSTLVIDPGIGQDSGLGWAFGPVQPPSLSVDPRLNLMLCCTHLGVVRPPPSPRLGASPSPVEMAHKAVCEIYQAINPLMITRVVVEKMVHYPPKRGRGAAESERTRTAKANDLIDLSEVGALVAAALSFQVGLTRIHYVTAHQWKGGLDTKVVERRLRGSSVLATAGVLTQSEIDLLDAVPKSIRHNAVDALAILCIEQGRLRLV